MDSTFTPEQQNTSKQKNSLLKIVSVLLACVLLLLCALLVSSKYLLVPPATEPELTAAEQKVLETQIAIAREVETLYAGEGQPKIAEMEPVPLETIGSGPVSDISGTVYFSGTYKDSKKGVSVYALDVVTGDIASYKPGEINALGIEFTTDENSQSAFLIRLTVNGDVVHFVTSSSSVQISDGSNLYIRNLEWSEEAGLLAYNSSKADETTVTSMHLIQNWDIVLVDPDSKNVVDTIKGGHQPKWLKDGSGFYFLASDGLYLYDRATKVRTKVVPVGDGEVVITTSKMDLSQDGTYLLWGTPKKGTLTLIEFSNPGVVKQYAQITSTASEYYWPHFSPGGGHFIVQAIDHADEITKERINARMEVWKVGSSTPLKSYSFTNFDFSQFFTDDWLF